MIWGWLGQSSLLGATVEFYGGDDYKNPLCSYDLGIYDMDSHLKKDGCNDAIKSLKINGDYRVTLFENNHFGGEAVTYYESSPKVSDSIYKKTSSITIENWKDSDYSAIFFEHNNNGGRMMALGTGMYDKEVIGDRLGNDKISSIKLPSGWKVTVYENHHFTGNSLEITSNKNSMGDDWNDKISSIIIEKTPTNTNIVQFFVDPQYKNEKQSSKFGIGRYDKPRLESTTVGNDAISSIKVPSGLKVTVFEKDSFGGKCRIYTSDVSQLASDLDNKVSSIVVEEFIDKPSATFCDDKEKCQTLKIGRYNKCILAQGNDSVGNDKISSIRIPAGLKVTIYEDDNFAKRRKTYYEDIDTIEKFMNHKTSSIIIEEWNDSDSTTFLLIADPQVTCDSCGGYRDIDVAYQRIVSTVDSLNGLTWPLEVRGDPTTLELAGQPIKPQYMVFAGDLVNWSAKDKRNKFKDYYDFKDNRGSAIQLYGYVGLGNHDFSGNDGAMRGYVKDQNTTDDAPYPAYTFDKESYTYSWTRSGVHFIQGHRFGGDNINDKRENVPVDYQNPKNSLSWISTDLETYGSSGKPVMIFQHYPLNGADDYWSDTEKKALDDTVKGYNIFYFHGHTHHFEYYTHNDGIHDINVIEAACNTPKWRDWGISSFYLVRAKSTRLEIVECRIDAVNTMAPVSVEFSRVFVFNLSRNPIGPPSKEIR
jgi:hypothetical protein